MNYVHFVSFACFFFMTSHFYYRLRFGSFLSVWTCASYFFTFFAHIRRLVSVHWRALVRQTATNFTCDERREITCSLSGVHFAYSFFGLLAHHKRKFTVDNHLTGQLSQIHFSKRWKTKFVLIVSPNRANGSHKWNHVVVWHQRKRNPNDEFLKKKNRSTGARDDWKLDALNSYTEIRTKAKTEIKLFSYSSNWSPERNQLIKFSLQFDDV